MTLVSYHKLFDVLKQFHKRSYDIRSERLARSANPLALLAAAQPIQITTAGTKTPKDRCTIYRQSSFHNGQVRYQTTKAKRDRQNQLLLRSEAFLRKTSMTVYGIKGQMTVAGASGNSSSSGLCKTNAISAFNLHKDLDTMPGMQKAPMRS
ncbi:hypothetical protein Tco_1549118 [Tanacetum coccineum]